MLPLTQAICSASAAVLLSLSAQAASAPRVLSIVPIPAAVGTPATIYAHVADADGNIDRVMFYYWDGSNWQPIQHVPTTAGSTDQWVSTQWMPPANQTYRIHVGVADTTGLTHDNAGTWLESPLTPPSADTLVAALPHEVSVDNKGSANVQIPLRIASGRSGMVPSLALAYNSSAGNGVVGIGWSLSTGFPQSITRGRSILARDSEVRGITFTATDKFYLDGKRLVCVTGTNGVPGSTYRTEVDSFVTVTATGAAGVIETFTVVDKSATRMVFGKLEGSTDGYQVGSLRRAPYGADSLAYAFALKRVTDVIGNTVDFSYDFIGDGEYVLKEISYTGNPSNGITAQNIVRFYYDLNVVPGNPAGQKTRLDQQKRYIAERLFRSTKRLDKIVSESSGSGGLPTYAQYDLTYGYGPRSGPTRLVGVYPTLRHMQNPAIEKLDIVAPTRIVWSNNEPASAKTPLNLLEEGGNPDSWAFADVNGDGKDDLVNGRHADRLEVSLSTGSGFAAATPWMTPPAGWPFSLRLGDIDGDGRKDLLWWDGTANGGRIYGALSTGTSFAPIGNGTPLYTFVRSPTYDFAVQPGSGSGRTTIADFTGDGRDDILLHGFDGKLKLLKSNGSSYSLMGEFDVGARAVVGHDDWTLGNLQFLGVVMYQDFSVSPMPCDLNGDGITDYAWTETSQGMDQTSGVGGSSWPTAHGEKRLYAVTSQPGGGFSQCVCVGQYGWGLAGISYGAHRSTSYMIIPGDMNGDGLGDFMIMAPGLMLPDSASGQNPRDENTGVTWPDRQQILNHMTFLSMGSPGIPTFDRMDQGIEPMVAVEGVEVRPWFDKVRIGVWINDRYAWASPDNEYKKRLMLGLGLAAPGTDNVLLADLNHDGMQDYVWYVTREGRQGWWVMYSRGNSFSSPVRAPVDWVPTPQVASGDGFMYLSTRSALDLNGDGIQDYSYDVVLSENAPGIEGFYLSAGQPDERVVAVVDALGSTTSLAYLPVTSDLIYTPGNVDNPATPSVEGVQYPIRESRNSTYVVSDVYKDSGGVTPSHFSYQYSGNRTDLSGRGPLGFHSFVTLDRQTNLFKYQFLAQSFPMTGLTAREQTYRYWQTGSGGSATVSFRAISSHDNTVVFDEVVKSPTDGTAWGTVYPFISQAVESRWEDSSSAHFSWAKGATPESKPELLFAEARPDGAHITISAQSWFDNQSTSGSPQTTIPGGYYASDRSTGWSTAGTNSAKGSTDYAAFHALTFPRKITYGNLTQLRTDFGGGFTEKVVTSYLPVTSNGLSGLVDKVVTSVTAPGYGSEASPEYAPDKRYSYWTTPGGTPTSLVWKERIDANRDDDAVDAAPDDLDLYTLHTRDALGRETSTVVNGVTKAGATTGVIGSLSQDVELHVSAFTAQYINSFDPKWDLPTSVDNAEGYRHTKTTQYHEFLGMPVSVTDAENGTTATTDYDALGRAVGVTDKNLKIATRTDFAWTTSAGSDWRKTQTVAPPEGHTGVEDGEPISGVVGVSVSSVYATQVRETLETGEDAFKPITWTYFDRLGRAIRVIKQTQTGVVQTDTAYNSLGQVIAVTNPYSPSSSATGPYWTKTSYDALGRVAKVVAPNETVTTNTYIGRVTKVTVDAPDLGGVNPAAQANATLVDYKGRTVKVWNADNIPTSFDPITGSMQVASVEYVLDGFGRMRATKLRDQAQQITATYDAHGRQTSLNDPDKGNWTYVNNALGHVVKQVDAKLTETRTTFDRLGRQLTRQTREASSGPVETADWYYYDASTNDTLHLVAKVAPTDAQPGGWIGAPQRDELRVTGAPGYAITGKAQTSDPDTSTTIYYDPKGRPAITLTTADAKWFYTYTTYDSQYPRVKQVRHYWRPPGHELASDLPYLWKDWGYNYSYDGRSYLTEVSDTAGRTWWSNPTYDHLDRVTSVKKGEITWTNRGYRAEDGVLTSIRTGTAASPENIQNLSFNFDGLGNLTSRSNGSRTENLTYDNLNRLTNSWQGAITYFDNGNIRRKADVGGTQATTDYGYSATRPHAVTSAWGYTMDYDANGNVISRAKSGESWDFRYAGFDKPRWMAKIAGSQVTGSEFLYNANRSRVLHLEFDQMAGGAPSHYTRKRVYGFVGNFELNYGNAAGAGVAADWKLGTIRIYVPGPDGNIGTMEFKANASFSDPEKQYVYHYDHLGSIEVITHRESSVIAVESDTGLASRFSYDAWGQRRNTQTWSGPPPPDSRGGASAVSPRGYTGHEMLDDLGLVHMNGRIYDPLIGRFLSADTVVDGPWDLQGYNRYSYVKNRPLSLTDPTGHLAFALPFIIPLLEGGAALTTAEGGSLIAAVVLTATTAMAKAGPGPVPAGSPYGNTGHINNFGGMDMQNLRQAQEARQRQAASESKLEKGKIKEGTSGGQIDPNSGGGDDDEKNKIKKETERRGDMQQSDSMHQPVEAGTDYSTVGDPKGGAQQGADFTQKTKDGVWNVNRARNAGVNRSDQSGTVIDSTKKSQAGVTPSPNEGQVDHKQSKANNGTNSATNAQLLTREENRKKSDKDEP